MKKTLLLLLMIGIGKIVAAQQYVINVQVTGFKDGTKFYLQDIDVDSNIDSALIRNNKFVLKGKLTETPKSLWLCTQTNNNFYYTVLLIGNDKVNIKGDIKDFPFDLSITGSKTQDVENQLTKLTKVNYKKRNQLVAEYFALKGDSAKIKGKQIWKVINKGDSLDNIIQMNFVKTHLNSYSALQTLFYLKGKFHRDTLQKMYDSLRPEFKQSSFAQRIKNYLKVGEILKTGDAMADIEAMDKTGKTHRLSNIKGKYILLDFSTTYCGPCMQSLDDLKSIAKRYEGKLEVITFSGDGGKETWLKGVNRDNPTWLSLWDGKGSYGETMLKYGVTGYPTFVLIDPQGKIVSKWSGYGKEDDGRGSLETKVDQLMLQDKPKQ